MAAPRYVANILRARYLWSDGVGDFGHHIDFSYVYTGGAPIAADLNSFAADAYSELVSDFIGTINEEYMLTECVVTPQDNGSFPTGSHTGTNVGGSTGQNPGSGVAQDLIWQVPLRYRGGRPRTSFPPPSTSNMVNAREWSSSAITGFNSAVASFMAHFLERSYGGITIGSVACVSYVHLGVPREPPLILLPSSGTLRPRLGSMRKRTRV